MKIADRILSFNKSLRITSKLPEGVGVLNPFKNSETFELCTQFYHKYYNDQLPRTMILGINPGRFGAGITGIPFTDPVKLQNICGIKNSLPMKAELSADFIYQLIASFGTPEKFYNRFYFGSISPLGFVKDNKNLNYYDEPALQKAIQPFIVKSITKQLDFGFNREICFCLGEGKNINYLNKLNAEKRFFKTIVPLPHPRFIMQYRRKRVDDYIQLYRSRLK